ncbi:hypothetical protein [Candidatus Neoehrlichia procyonis]|uniref:Uncharacterized protein n=1 Tax=Candidatus Neoehrlichia procyonis str. RAC413 TaxID=1359163 RepID=A0A0F3NM46_9RICK|nr:hypothetical protein [Candidatus Neoehrlichia lotoris]KJV68856.1 hypothetical protein NLO413_0224 [Candidatus Neoehrlichia lotoris str. RAC413]
MDLQEQNCKKLKCVIKNICDLCHINIIKCEVIHHSPYINEHNKILEKIEKLIIANQYKLRMLHDRFKGNDLHELKEVDEFFKLRRYFLFLLENAITYKGTKLEFNIIHNHIFKHYLSANTLNTNLNQVQSVKRLQVFNHYLCCKDFDNDHMSNHSIFMLNEMNLIYNKYSELINNEAESKKNIYKSLMYAAYNTLKVFHANIKFVYNDTLKNIGFISIPCALCIMAIAGTYTFKTHFYASVISTIFIFCASFCILFLALYLTSLSAVKKFCKSNIDTDLQSNISSISCSTENLNHQTSK